MSIQVILCPINGSEADGHALKLAFTIADNFGAHVRALFVRPDVTAAMPFLGEGISGAIVEDIVKAAKQAADESFAAARKSLDHAMTQANRKLGDKVSLLESEGFIPDEIAAASRLVDLVVFGPDVEDMPLPEQTAAERTLLAAHRPVMLAPKRAVRSVGAKVAILWDGGDAAAAAVLAGMPFIGKAQSVEIVHGRKNADSEKSLNEIKDALALRGIKPLVRVVDVAGKADGPALAEAVSAAEADLVVMGGYGHSRFREIVLGGVTRHMLRNASVPVLMAH